MYIYLFVHNIFKMYIKYYFKFDIIFIVNVTFFLLKFWIYTSSRLYNNTNYNDAFITKILRLNPDVVIKKVILPIFAVVIQTELYASVL